MSESMEECPTSTTSTTSGSVSESDPLNPCPICLQPFSPSQASYLDRCFHKFCCKCIEQWTKVVASKQSPPPNSISCPLCKTKNFSFIYDFDGNSFQRCYFDQINENSNFFSEAHKYRLRCYCTDAGSMCETFNVDRFWKLRRYLQPNKWLFNWLRRETQALMQTYILGTYVQEEDVDVVVHHLHGLVDSFLTRDDPRRQKPPETVRKEFKTLLFDASRPFLGGRSQRFVDETELFLASGLNIEAYDEVYRQQMDQDVLKAASESMEVDSSEYMVAAPYSFFFNEDSDGDS